MSGMTRGGRFIARRLRCGQDHHGNLAAPFAGPKSLENLSAIPFGQMKVQKDQIWTMQRLVSIDLLNELYDLFAIADNMRSQLTALSSSASRTNKTSAGLSSASRMYFEETVIGIRRRSQLSCETKAIMT
jgi:hypothetical protein